MREDLPEETTVFRLEPASEDIIERLVRKRFSHISQVDARTIAAFSGGNARLAISLANTVQHGETLSGFHNEELFKRLFWQRNDPSNSLLVSAEACSLVYSFEGTDTSSEKSELQFVASLVNKSVADLYRDVTELKKRDLIQSRGVWRAVLPHAIANRLARRALESIPRDVLVGRFLSDSSERLIRSFTRRLSFLHDCEAALAIVNDWLGQDGWIGKSIHNLNTLDMDVLRNIAPVAPEKTLEAIERAANGPEGASFISRENSHHTKFIRLLRHLAYDPALFDRSVELICRYALSEGKDENNNSTRDLLKSLFYIYLSGTHAPVEVRARIIEKLVDSENQDKQDLGLLLLDATLEAWHFSSSYEFGFGARPRDYGYEPKTQEEIAAWFDTFIDIVTRLALSDQPIAEKARKLLANNLRGLWTKAGRFDAIEESARKIQAQKAWNDGWIAVREILRYEAKEFSKVLERLRRLENLLKPYDLLEQARTFALSDQHGPLDLADDFDDSEAPSAGWHRAEETTRKIGAQVAQSPDTLKALLPELVSTNGVRLRSFGCGLADGCSDKHEMFNMLRVEIEKASPEKRNIDVLLGFLSASAVSDPSFYNSILDTLVRDDILGQFFPAFQTISTIDQRGVERLHEALDLGKAQIHTFRYLAFGGAHESIKDDDLAKLLKKILSKEEGIGVAIDILQMRFHDRNDKSPKVPDNLLAVARDVLSMYSFEEKRMRQSNRDYGLAKIARMCLDGKDGVPAATEICQRVAKAVIDRRVFASDYHELIESLAQTQPRVFLEVFLGGNNVQANHQRRLFSLDIESRTFPLDQIPDDEFLSWCEDDPAVRYPIVAGAIRAFTKSAQTGKLEWKPVVYAIFERAPDLDPILEHLADAIMPRSWSGSRADILLSRAGLFQELYKHDNAKIRAWAKAQYSALQETIQKEREWEEQRARKRDERFE